MKMKKSSAVIYVLALMLVTAGYWAYLSNETKTIETVSSENQNTTDEHLGDATLVNSNDVTNETTDNEKETETNTTNTTTTSAEETKKDDYFQESKLSRDTMYSQTLETYQKMLRKKCNNDKRKFIIY